ncbi:hypothetical protein COCMIDRAFT_104208 [Bipolaris oryzae ATCC 44560]|uniref:N-acetyltransferase domain-containing protein n=1 Tax=Bipolaris oryzae ATCC 44560 TaxID=930090 RepID=W6YRW0_COCMI|nr:uncharacterized protein COCMIDRAFT_104208 [Bipolaris oryzae ATCC 44560]EUC42177.1 hypothetical protein COCMIDRAFT_104208 [Bipolaris oryzae ATCC 44560]
MQSSLTSWLKKSSSERQLKQPQQPQQPLNLPLVMPPKTNRPPPPPKSASAPTGAPLTTTPTPSAMENWNDIPDDFLQAPSRPKSKKSPRSSRAVTPVASTIPSPNILPVQQPLKPQLFALRPLPPNVQLVPLTEDLMPAFKRLNTLTLPISYPESFYKETMTEPHHGITLVAVWHSSPAGEASEPLAEQSHLVGAVRCRLLPSSQLYISTLGVLAPYRSHGIAMHLLQAIVKKAVDLHSVRSVIAHVWEANEEGMEWYKKRSFDIVGKEEGYYRKLKPQGALLVRKWIGVGDLLDPSILQKDGLTGE